jgi:hypothetical protein
VSAPPYSSKEGAGPSAAPSGVGLGVSLTSGEPFEAAVESGWFVAESTIKL